MASKASAEVIYDLDAASFCSDDFRMFQFKVSARAGRALPGTAMQIAARTAHTTTLRGPRSNAHALLLVAIGAARACIPPCTRSRAAGNTRVPMVRRR